MLKRNISPATFALSAFSCAFIGFGGAIFNFILWWTSDNTCNDEVSKSAGDRETLILTWVYALGYALTNLLLLAKIAYDTYQSPRMNEYWRLNDAGFLTFAFLWLFFFSGLWVATAQTPAFLCQNNWAYLSYAWGIVAFLFYTLMAFKATDTLLKK